MTKYITLTQVLALPRCDAYSDARVRELFAGRTHVTLRTVAHAPIPAEDRLWVLIHCADVRTQRLFACDCAARALSRVAAPDQRSIDAERVARLHADGQATDAELAAAWDVAWAADGAVAWAAGDAAWAAWAAQTAVGAAAWAAAWAAQAAARAAAGDAWADAGDAEREWQLAHLAEMMEVIHPPGGRIQQE